MAFRKIIKMAKTIDDLANELSDWKGECKKIDSLIEVLRNWKKDIEGIHVVDHHVHKRVDEMYKASFE